LKFKIYKPKNSVFHSSAFVANGVLKSNPTSIDLFLSNTPYYSDAKSTTLPLSDD